MAFVAFVLTGSPDLAEGVTPRFRALSPLTVPIGADAGKNSFTLADVNNDGRADLITIEPEQSRVDVFLNRGDGTFDLSSTPGDGDITPTSVAVADIGSPFASDDAGKPDGKPDIVVGGDSGEVAIIFGRNDGQFDSPTSDDIIDPDATNEILGLVVGDFDERNGVDVALLDDLGVVILCNDGNGNLDQCSGAQPIAVLSDPVRISSGDFDADADLDVAVLDGDAQTVSILLGHGDATFDAVRNLAVKAQATQVGDRATDMDVARLDSDNTDDIVVVNNSDFDLNLGAIVLGGAGGRFRVTQTVVDFSATAITLADFDGDRADDAVYGYEDAAPSMALGSGNGELGDPGPADGAERISSAAALDTADVAGDTLPDLVILNFDGDEIRVAVNISNEATPTPNPMTPSPGTTPNPTPTGPPQATGTMTSTSTQTPSATATATPTPIPTADYGRCDGQVGGNLAAVAAGDLDGDELPDLVASDSSAGVVRIVYNADALAQVKACARAMAEQTIPSTSVALGGRTPGPIAIADLDHDGVNEIAVGAGDRVLILKRSSGTYTVAGEVVTGGTVRAITASYPDHPSDPRSRGLLDLNEDRVGDLVIANGTTTLTIVYGIDGQLPGRQVTQSTSCGATAADAGDFSGDGRIDIAVGCGSRASWLQQQATNGDTPTFQPKNDFATGSTVVGLTAGYLDRNSLSDLLITRGGSAPAGETYLFSNGTFVLASSGSFGIGTNPVAGGLGRLNPAHNRFDAVVAGQSDGSVLQFAYNDGNGGFPGPMVMPFDVHDTPRALVVVDFDNDGQQDVALANDDGTLTILVSSEPPPTPTPTITPPATVTGTATPSDTPSVTPTHTPSASPTPSPTGTSAASPTRTVTPGPSPTATNTRGGLVLSSCAITDSGGSAPVQVALIAALLACARLLAARRRGAVRARHDRS